MVTNPNEQIKKTIQIILFSKVTDLKIDFRLRTKIMKINISALINDQMNLVYNPKNERIIAENM
jgi:hypothetical protein